MRKLNKVMLWVLTPIVLAFTIFPHQIFALLVPQQTDLSQPIAPAERRVVLHVEGMT